MGTINYEDRLQYFENENYLSPTDGYPERPVKWFKEVILSDAIKQYSGKKTLLDVGCAHGYYTVLFTPYFDKVVGFDFAKNRIEFAKNNWKEPNLSFENIDLTDCNYTGKFDSMFTSMVIQHIKNEDKIKAFYNLYKLADENCIFVMYDFNTDINNNISWDDFVTPIGPNWIKRNAPMWDIESCELFTKEMVGQEGIYRYVLKRGK